MLEKIESYLTKKLREDDYYNDYYLNELMADMMNNQKNRFLQYQICCLLAETLMKKLLKLLR